MILTSQAPCAMPSIKLLQGVTIPFQSGITGTISLNSLLPVINKNLTIDGSGASITISGSNAYRILQIDGGTVSIKNLTLADGRVVGANGADGYVDSYGNPSGGKSGSTASGGAVVVNNGTVSFDGVTFSNNQASGGSGGRGADEGFGNYAGHAGSGGRR